MYLTTQEIKGKTRAVVISNNDELVKVLDERIIDGEKYVKVPSYLMAMIESQEFGIPYDSKYWKKNRDTFEFIPAPPQQNGEEEISKGLLDTITIAHLLADKDKTEEISNRELSRAEELARRIRRNLSKMR